MTFVKTIALCLFAVAWIAPVQAAPRSFHVDCDAKGDEGSGESPAFAWKSLDRANRAALAPGDRLLLRAGCAFTGTLAPQGSGEPGRPIVIDRYGTGALPRIDGQGATAALLLKDQQHVEVGNLRLTNSAPTPGLRRGVLVLSEKPGTLSHIYLRDLEVTQVSGQLGADMISKTTGGIGFEARGKEATGRFDDILIERWGNVIARAAARLHGNAIYVFGSKDARIQGNEVHHTRYEGLEGAAFDSDFNSEGTIIQYNYSHNNGGGLANICASPPRGYNDGTIIRYNVSRDETDRVIAFDGPATNTLIHNNTVFVSKGLSPRIIEFDVFGKSAGYADTVRIVNNIFVNEGSGTYVPGGATNVSYEGNCFAGFHPPSEPDDPKKEMKSPSFTAPATVGAGLSSVAGYRLLDGSPCTASAIPLSPRPERDLLGTPIPEAADRGALQRLSASRPKP